MTGEQSINYAEAIKAKTKEKIEFYRRGNAHAPEVYYSDLAFLSAAISALREQEEWRWIPVAERLPAQPPNRVDEQGRSWFTPNIDCIVYDSENVFAAHYCFQNKCFWYADTLHPLKNITHWMPLPKPPKGE